MDLEAHGNRVSEVLAAYLSSHHVPVDQLGTVIQTINAELLKIGAPGALANAVSAVTDPEPKSERKTPSQIRNSVRPDAIISFIDGKSYKTLKRHLTTHGLTPQTYRERYGLPADYPVVAREYAERRSTLAKAIGLGQVGAQAARARGVVPTPGTEHETEVRQSHE